MGQQHQPFLQAGWRALSLHLHPARLYQIHSRAGSEVYGAPFDRDSASGVGADLSAGGTNDPSAQRDSYGSGQDRTDGFFPEVQGTRRGRDRTDRRQHQRYVRTAGSRDRKTGRSERGVAEWSAAPAADRPDAPAVCGERFARFQNPDHLDGQLCRSDGERDVRSRTPGILRNDHQRGKPAFTYGRADARPLQARKRDWQGGMLDLLPERGGGRGNEKLPASHQPPRDRGAAGDRGRVYRGSGLP